MDQEWLDARKAQADEAERQLMAMGPRLRDLADIEIAVSFADLTVQATPLVGGSFGGALTALRG